MYKGRGLKPGLYWIRNREGDIDVAQYSGDYRVSMKEDFIEVDGYCCWQMIGRDGLEPPEDFEPLAEVIPPKSLG